MAGSRRLLPRVYDALRARHYSRRTEEAYVQWIKRFIFFHSKRHPASMGGEEVNALLTWLATEQNVSESTQNQALGARSEEHTSELQSRLHLVCRLLLEKKK